MISYPNYDPSFGYGPERYTFGASPTSSPVLQEASSPSASPYTPMSFSSPYLLEEALSKRYSPDGVQLKNFLRSQRNREYDLAFKVAEETKVGPNGKKRMDLWPAHLRERAQRLMDPKFALTGAQIAELIIALDAFREENVPEIRGESDQDYTRRTLAKIVNEEYDCGITCAAPWIPPTGKFTFKEGSDDDLRESVPKTGCTFQDVKKAGLQKTIAAPLTNLGQFGLLSPNGEEQETAVCDMIDDQLTTDLKLTQAAFDDLEGKYNQMTSELNVAINQLLLLKDFVDGTRSQLAEQVTRNQKGDYYVLSKWRSSEELRALRDIITIRGKNLDQQIRGELIKAGFLAGPGQPKKPSFLARLFA